MAKALAFILACFRLISDTHLFQGFSRIFRSMRTSPRRSQENPGATWQARVNIINHRLNSLGLLLRGELLASGILSARSVLSVRPSAASAFAVGLPIHHRGGDLFQSPRSALK